jgi:hypothetical protein
VVITEADEKKKTVPMKQAITMPEEALPEALISTSPDKFVETPAEADTLNVFLSSVLKDSWVETMKNSG